MRADRHELCDSGQPKLTAYWLRKYGYRCLPCVPSDASDGWWGGIVFARPGEPVQMAVVGDVLRYDKRKKIVVVDYAKP